MRAFWRISRSVVLGIAIGLLLAKFLERTPEGVDTPTVIGLVGLLVVGIGLRRWLLFRREREKQEEDGGGTRQ